MISILMASRGRPAQAARCMERVLQTTKHLSAIEFLVGVRVDEYQPYLAIQTMPRVTLIAITADHAVSAWNGLGRIAIGDIFCMVCDDVWPHDRWLDHALHCLKKNPQCLIALNDLLRDDQLATCPLATRSFLREVSGGVLNVPHYFSQFADVELTERAKRAGRFAYCEAAILEHRHFTKNPALMDDTYRIGQSYFEQDRATYQHRLERGFPDDFEGYL
jgi:hypothetical protein